MSAPLADGARGRAVLRRRLGPLLRRLRRVRGLTCADMADALEIDIRTYERLAAGRTQLDLARVLQLADALDADPLGLVAALRLGDPAVAVASADAKPLLILALTLRRLSAREAEALSRATAAEVVRACDQLVGDLLRRTDPFARDAERQG